MQLEPQQKEVSSSGVERRVAVEEKLRKHQRIMKKKRNLLRSAVAILLVKKCITINTVCAFISVQKAWPH